MMEVDRTIVKSKQPQTEVSGDENQPNNIQITVEQYLQSCLKEMTEEIQIHAQRRCDMLRREFERAVSEMRAANPTQAVQGMQCVITLSVTTGEHRGETFQLAGQGGADELFKIGRSSGKAFKTKGVSLKKDKEISTTHAKIETRGSKVFLTDLHSTNGTSLNGEEVAPDEPMEVKDGDVITLGKTDLSVTITMQPIV